MLSAPLAVRSTSWLATGRRQRQLCICALDGAESADYTADSGEGGLQVSQSQSTAETRWLRIRL